MTYYKRNNFLALTFLAVALLPFQSFPSTLETYFVFSFGFYSDLLDYLDELILVIVFFYVACETLIYRKSLYLNEVLWYTFFFILFCLILIGAKEIYLLRGLVAIYDYTKNFLIFLIFFSLSYKSIDLEKIIKLVLWVSVFISLIGIFSAIFTLFSDTLIGILVDSEKRFGIHRVYSVTGRGNLNHFGMYLVLSFYLLHVHKNLFKYSKLFLIIIFTTIILTFSRQTWLAFVLFWILFNYRKNFL